MVAGREAGTHLPFNAFFQEKCEDAAINRPQTPKTPNFCSKKILSSDSEKHFASALSVLVPTAPSHDEPLVTPISNCFNWNIVNEMVPADEEFSWYQVVFRSVRRVTADTEALYAADAEAHEEAIHGGGLLMYWYGSLNHNRECLATCIWESREAAMKALCKPKHVVAMRLADQMFESYVLERYHFVRKGANLAWTALPPSSSTKQRTNTSIER